MKSSDYKASGVLLDSRDYGGKGSIILVHLPGNQLTPYVVSRYTVGATEWESGAYCGNFRDAQIAFLRLVRDITGDGKRLNLSDKSRLHLLVTGVQLDLVEFLVSLADSVPIPQYTEDQATCLAAFRSYADSNGATGGDYNRHHCDVKDCDQLHSRFPKQTEKIT